MESIFFDSENLVIYPDLPLVGTKETSIYYYIDKKIFIII